MLSAVASTEKAVEQVKDDSRSRIADMGKIIDRWSAHIHRDTAWVGRLENLLFGGERIVELHCELMS